MTHWIVESMVYPVHDQTTHRHKVQHWSAGIRVSCDDGASWVVRGTIPLGARDSMETRTREVSAIEYSARVRRGHRITVLPPPGSVLRVAK